MPEQTLADRHRDLYARIPKFQCIEGCTDCCGPVPFSGWEWEQVLDKREHSCLSCPYSHHARCDIYEHRPFMCRLFGTVEDLRCPHGAGPEVLLTREAAQALMAEYEQLQRECGTHLSDAYRMVFPESNSGSDLSRTKAKRGT